MTVSKAYQRLTDAGILEVRRGEGTFVAAAPPAMPKAERSRALREAATRYVAVAATLGATLETVQRQVADAWRDTQRGGDQ
jgi:DNA-binding transcriptional regulator YhcF (GntR family)